MICYHGGNGIKQRIDYKLKKNPDQNGSNDRIISSLTAWKSFNLLFKPVLKICNRCNINYSYFRSVSNYFSHPFCGLCVVVVFFLWVESSVSLRLLGLLKISKRAETCFQTIEFFFFFAIQMWSHKAVDAHKAQVHRCNLWLIRSASSRPLKWTEGDWIKRLDAV